MRKVNEKSYKQESDCFRTVRLFPDTIFFGVLNKLHVFYA